MNLEEAKKIVGSINGAYSDVVVEKAEKFIEGYEQGVRNASEIARKVTVMDKEGSHSLADEVLELLDEVKK